MARHRTWWWSAELSMFLLSGDDGHGGVSPGDTVILSCTAAVFPQCLKQRSCHHAIQWCFSTDYKELSGHTTFPFKLCIKMFRIDFVLFILCLMMQLHPFARIKYFRLAHMMQINCFLQSSFTAKLVTEITLILAFYIRWLINWHIPFSCRISTFFSRSTRLHISKNV